MNTPSKHDLLTTEFLAAANAKVQPPTWPTQLLLDWAWALLQLVVSPVDAESLLFETTHWVCLYDTTGELRAETFGDFALWLDYTSALRVLHKNDVPAWSPGRFKGNIRSDEATEVISALVVDCDDHGARDQLLTALYEVGLAFVAHDTPSHGALAADGLRRLDKWRVVVPLAQPIRNADLARWRDAYTAARVLLAAIGNCWLDHTTHNPSRLWFAASAVGDATTRNVEYCAGRALDLGRLLASSPERPVQPPSPPARARQTGASALRGRRYLQSAGPAPLGCRNETAFRLAVRLLNTVGCDSALTHELLAEWNDRNPEPLPDLELHACIANASRAATKVEVKP